MAEKKRLTKIITGVIVGSMILSSSIIAFASQGKMASNNKGSYFGLKDKKDNFGKRKGPGMDKKRGHENLTNMLSELVKDGTITQGESDKITAYLKTKQEQKKAEMEKVKGMTKEQRDAYFKAKAGERKDLLSELVDNGTITKAKADAIKNKIQEKNQAKRETRIKEIETNLNSLVQKGTITNEQANKVIENIKSRDEERKAVMEKVKNMTPEERKDYLKEHKGEGKGFLKDMVDKGTLTKDQANAIRQSIKGFPQKAK